MAAELHSNAKDANLVFDKVGSYAMRFARTADYPDSFQPGKSGWAACPGWLTKMVKPSLRPTPCLPIDLQSQLVDHLLFLGSNDNIGSFIHPVRPVRVRDRTFW
jgi:hypothetical protein